MMTDNRLLLWSVSAALAYVIGGAVLPGVYVSSFTSLALLLFGGAALIRYAPEAYKIVILRARNDSNPYGDGSHLAAYGVSLLAGGSVYIGVFGLVWVYFGQPMEWTGTAISSVGKIMMAIGYALIWVSPDVTRQGVDFPKTIWLCVLGAVALVMAFFLGIEIGKGDIADAAMLPCPVAFPVKANTRSMIYHVPTDRTYSVTKPEACLRDDKTARRMGLRAPK